MADSVVVVTNPTPQTLTIPQQRVPQVAQLLDWSGAPISSTNPLPVAATISGNQAINIVQVGGSAVTAGAGAVAAGTQRITLASDDPAVATLGATTGTKVITDANGTVQQYLRGLVSQWIASTLTFASQAYSAAVSQTRPNDTNAYAANDVIGTATGSTAALTFAVAPGVGGEVMITSVAMEVDVAAVISGEAGYRLYLYNVTPPSALGDNAAWDLPSGDRASYLGFVDLGQPVDLGSTLYIETNGINKQIKAASGNVFAYLVTLGAFTPAAQTVRVITVHTVAL